MAGPTMMGKTGILRTIYKRMLVEMRRTDGATYSRMLVPRIKSGSTKKRRLRATIQRLCNGLVTDNTTGVQSAGHWEDGRVHLPTSMRETDHLSVCRECPDVSSE